MSLFHSTLLHDSDSTTKRKAPVQQLKSELSGLTALITRRVLAAPISYSYTPFANSISTITVWIKESACVDLSLRLDLVGVRLCAWRDVPSMLSAHYVLADEWFHLQLGAGPSLGWSAYGEMTELQLRSSLSDHLFTLRGRCVHVSIFTLVLLFRSTIGRLA